MSSMRPVSTSFHRIVAPVLLGVLGLVPLGLSTPTAHAIDMQGSEIVIELELPDDDGDFGLTTDVERIGDFFNLANCICSDVNMQAKLSLDMPASTYDDPQLEIWVGNSCDSDPDRVDVRDESCEMASTLANVEVLFSTTRVPIPVFQLLAPNSDTCDFEEDTRSVYALIDEGADGIDGDDYSATPLEIPFDMRPPPAVEDISVDGAENAVQINWDLPSSRQEDIRYVQVLCARADGIDMPDKDGFPLQSNEKKAKFLTSFNACGIDADNVHPTIATSSSAAFGPEPDAGVTDAGVTDAGVTDAGVTDAGVPDAGTGPDAGPVDETLPESLYNLDPKTICGEVGGTESSVRVGGLENGVEYRIVLLTIDDARNATALDLGTHTPQPVQDAWEHYQDNGGNADGGYCFVATATYGNYNHPFVQVLRTFRDETLAHNAWGRAFIEWYYENSPGLAAFIADHSVVRGISYLALAPLVVFAAVLEYTSLAGKFALLAAFGLALFLRRRRKANALLNPAIETARTTPRRRFAMAAATIVLLLGFSATANAQPYWDELNEDLQMGETTPKWNLEIKLGPYHPSVDDNVSGGKKPFETVFGNEYQLMPLVTLDRYFSFPMGQLGITGTIGYSRQSAKSFSLDSSGNTIPDPENGGLPTRSDGDSTSFSLIPTSIGVVYRFTELDDKYGIPLVPYGRLGLSYYLWKFTAPDGEISESPTDGCPAPGPGSNCEGNLARGGSFGYQGTIGIAVRAERIDPHAALSLRNEMGVEHAGFFIEGQLAVVDGFGSDKKLSVGDTTWFGGINFEF